MKKILVPLDFSDCSDNALKNAIRLAERMNMELILMHSYTVPAAMAEHAPGALIQELELAEMKAKNEFANLEERFPDLADVKYQESVEGGMLLDNVKGLVKANDVAFIVMGTHGASGLQRVLLGSNAYSIMKHVKCPVIAIPDGADITKMKHIALGGDYKSIPGHDCIQPLIDLTKALYAELHVIHIDQDKELDHDEMDIARGLDKYLKSVKHSFHFKNDYDVEEGLLSFVKEQNVGLLAMISRHHSFLDRLSHGSETKRMMMDIPMPLMILHE